MEVFISAVFNIRVALRSVTCISGCLNNNHVIILTRKQFRPIKLKPRENMVLINSRFIMKKYLLYTEKIYLLLYFTVLA